VDETDLGLARRLAHLHSSVVYPGHPGIPGVPRGSQDEQWLRAVGEMNLVVITRDRQIRYKPVEKQAWVSFEVRGFVLTGRISQSTEESLSILRKHWSRMVSITSQRLDRPWMYAVTGSGLREIIIS